MTKSNHILNKLFLLSLSLCAMAYSKPIDCASQLDRQIFPDNYLGVWMKDKKLFNVDDLVDEMAKDNEMTKYVSGIKFVKNTQMAFSGIGYVLVYGGVMTACAGIVSAANSNRSAMNFIKYGGLTAVGGLNILVLSLPLDIIYRNKTTNAIKKYNEINK